MELLARGTGNMRIFPVFLIFLSIASFAYFLFFSSTFLPFFLPTSLQLEFFAHFYLPATPVLTIWRRVGLNCVFNVRAATASSSYLNRVRAHRRDKKWRGRRGVE